MSNIQYRLMNIQVRNAIFFFFENDRATRFHPSSLDIVYSLFNIRFLFSPDQ